MSLTTNCFNSKKDYSRLGESADDDTDADVEPAKSDEPAKNAMRKAALPDAPPVPSLSKQGKNKDSACTVNGNSSLVAQIVICNNEADCSGSSTNDDSGKSSHMSSISLFEELLDPLHNTNRQDLSTPTSNSTTGRKEIANCATPISSYDVNDLATTSTSRRLVSTPTSMPMTNDINKTLVTILLETKTTLKELQRQTQINTQLLQTMMDSKGDDAVIELCNLPVDNKTDLRELENLLGNDKAILTKLVNISIALMFKLNFY
jgi:hypothetical protein